MERISDGYKQSSMVLNEWIIVLSSFYSLIQSLWLQFSISVISLSKGAYMSFGFSASLEIAAATFDLQ